MHKEKRAVQCVTVRACVQCVECTRGVTVVRRARACVGEIVRVRRKWEYPSAVVGIWIRYSPQIVYNHRAPAPAPRSARSTSHRHRLSDARQAPFRLAHHHWFGLPLQAVAPQCVANNSLQHTSYGMGFLQSKTSDRGGGGSTCYYDGDGDA